MEQQLTMNETEPAAEKSGAIHKIGDESKTAERNSARIAEKKAV